ncbi:MAG: RidA family protein [Lachnospiraceae bacterium]|nr:RidA family protein [Lachnospiraceae bacterium]
MADILRKISTDKAPGAIGPYSQAIAVGNMLYTSGQVPIIPETGAVIEGDILVQTTLVCENIGAILAAAGIDFENVIKTTCFLTDMADFAAFNSVYEKFFVEKPARSCVAVRQLPRDVLCEIEVIALLPDVN